MAEKTLVKKYINHRGLDEKSSDLVRPSEFASDMKNAQYRKSGAFEKRMGYEAFAPSQGGHGTFTYNKKNTATAASESEVVCVGDRLYKLELPTITITYSGVDSAIVSILYDPATSQYRCQITEGTTLVLDKALGKGFDEATTITLANLKTDIDAITDFSATISGTTTTPAAFLKTVRDQNISSTAYTAEAGNWLAVNRTVSSGPFSGSETNKDDTDFENASAVQIQNVLYITNGYDEVQKYDGQTVYRAGIPNVSSLTAALVGGGSITGTDYRHKAQYIQKDNVGNLVEGNTFASTSGLLSPTGQSFDVTVANVQAGSGFNTNCAIAAGAQVTVNTITVDDGSGGGHTLKAGDTAYFFDSVTGAHVERNVDSVTATTITVAGAAVTVADNAVISNNLRIALYRNASGTGEPTLFSLVDEFPNDSFSATQVINDNVVDASLGADLIEPLTDRSPPPKGRYISEFQNQMVISGNLESPNDAFYSDVDGPEYFPAGVNAITIENKEGAKISGIAKNNETFVIFQRPVGITVVSGSLADNNIRVDTQSTDIGCESHHSIQEVRGELYFLSNVGPRKMVGGQLPKPLGPALDDTSDTSSRIDPVFEQFGVLETEQIIAKKRVVGFHDRMGERYWLYSPAESTTVARHANSSSEVLVYDYSRDAWLRWDNINAIGGITQLGNDILFSERRLSTFNSTVDHILYRVHTLNDKLSYQDNVNPIDWNYKGNWESLGEPSVLKRFLRIRVFILEQTNNNDPTIQVKTESNYVEDDTKADFTISFTGSGYGVSAYGNSPYGNPDEPARKHKLNQGRLRSQRVLFVNDNDQENVIVTGWELEMATPFRLELKD